MTTDEPATTTLYGPDALPGLVALQVGWVVLHRIPLRFHRFARWQRMWISVADCGVMCGPPVDPGGPVTWCVECFPRGTEGVWSSESADQ